MMALSGYADRWSVARGQAICFMVHCDGATSYEADIVRLRQPEVGPSGQLFEPEPLPGSRRVCVGRRQTTRSGSSVLVPLHRPALRMDRFTMMAYVFPTTPRLGRRQAIMGCWSERTREGCGLELDEDGALRFLARGEDGEPTWMSTGLPLTATWYFVAVSYDEEAGIATLWQEPLDGHRLHVERSIVARDRMKAAISPLAWTHVTFAAWCERSPTEDGGTRMPRLATHFNGCIEGPRIARGCLSRSELGLLDVDPCGDALAGRLVAAWDFALAMSGDVVHDIGPNGFDGAIVNQPQRGVPGHAWDGETDWTTAPRAYGAIHFHDDDLIDAGWEPDFSFVVPDALRSGVYAARLTAGRHLFWIPFVVKPPRGEPRSKLVLLLPTATYDAYRNHRGRFQSLANEQLHGRLNTVDAIDAMFLDAPEMGLSTYDRHSDGSGVAYAGRRRPAYNIRPTGRLWNFNVDLLIVSWLDRLGDDCDVVTDEDLQEDGADLLAPYRVLITGSHPEYASTRMLDALETFVRGGGRLMYMGGNGFYWRIAFHPERRDLMEIRRSEGVRAWDAPPGATHMSFDGARGGLWRRNGRAPQCLVGVGFVSQGFDRCSHYRRTAAAADPRVAFMFEGVDGECLGGFGLLGNGAAGIEIDAANASLGTPAHALVVARSENHSNTYELAGEEVLVPNGATDALINPSIRAEMVFFETPRGGAVFSTGSIAYAGALGHEDFDNDVCRLTTNVLRRFLEEAPFALPESGNGASGPVYSPPNR